MAGAAKPMPDDIFGRPSAASLPAAGLAGVEADTGEKPGAAAGTANVVERDDNSSDREDNSSVEYAGGGGLLAAGGEWCVAAVISSLNKCNPELSPSGCGGEHKPGAFGNKFNRLNVKINPCVDRTCNIGITGICFSSNVNWCVVPVSTLTPIGNVSCLSADNGSSARASSF